MNQTRTISDQQTRKSSYCRQRG